MILFRASTLSFSAQSDRCAVDRGFRESSKPMSAATFAISAKGLANVPISDARNDFGFVVGDMTYKCPSLIADFLSPRVAKLHLVHETID
jgi:hypothetical protein